MPVQIQQNADGAAGCDATLDTLLVGTTMLEPGPLTVDVHCPTFIIFTCTYMIHKKKEI